MAEAPLATLVGVGVAARTPVANQILARHRVNVVRVLVPLVLGSQRLRVGILMRAVLLGIGCGFLWLRVVIVKEDAEKSGRYGDRAEEVAARTVLKQHQEKGHKKGQ